MEAASSLVERLPLAEHVARAARVLARTRSGTLGADDVLVGRGTTVVLAARGDDGVEPATLKPPPGDEGDDEDAGTQTESPEREAVRSLGALLHFVLAGAFPGPEPLGELADGAPPALVAIAERALGREKGAVYVGPGELADDLERALVKSAPPAVSADPAAARRRRIALMTAAAVAALAVGTLTLGWLRERRLRENATRAAEDARAGRRSDSFVVAQAFADKAAALAADDVQLSAAVYAAAVVDKIPDSDSRPQARALRLDAEGQILAARLGLVQGIESDREAGGAVTAMAAVPRSIATASGHAIKLWREKGEPAGGLTGHADDVVALALSSNGAVLASADRAGAIKVWDTAGRRSIHDLRTGGAPPADLAVAPVATGFIAAAERGGAVTLFALGTGSGSVARTLPAHRADATAVAFSPEGDLLATGARDGTLALWNPASGAQVGKLGGHSAAVLDLTFAPDGHLLASSAADGSVRLWSPTERTLVAGLAGHRAAVTSLAFSPDGAMLCGAAADGSVRAWFVADGEPALALDGHERGATFTAITSAGLIVTAGADGHVRTWRLGGARTLQAPAELTGAIAFSPDGAVVAAAAVDHRVHRFRLETGQPLPPLAGHAADVGGIAFSPDGTLVATAGDDGTARLWKAADGQPLSSLVGHKGPVEAVAFAPGGVMVATAGDDHTVRLWSSQGAQALGVLAEHKDRVVDVAFSPDGKRLAAVGWDGLLQLWTVQQKGAVPLKSVPGKGRWFSVEFSPDGASLVAAGDRGVILFRASGDEVATVEGPGSSAVDARFTPDGKMIASAGADGSVRVHTVAGARPVLAIAADPPLVAVAGAVDGTLLAWGDGPRIRLAPLDLSLLERPAAEVRRDAETAAGMELRGFALAHR